MVLCSTFLVLMTLQYNKVCFVLNWYLPFFLSNFRGVCQPNDITCLPFPTLSKSLCFCSDKLLMNISLNRWQKNVLLICGRC